MLTAEEHARWKETGAYIRELRKRDTDITLREFARKLDKSPSYISDIERGARPIPDYLMRQIARVLAVNATHVYNNLLELSGMMSTERRMLIELRADLLILIFTINRSLNINPGDGAESAAQFLIKWHEGEEVETQAP